MKLIRFKKAIGFSILTLSIIFSCNYSYAFGSEENNTYYNNLMEENKRLNNLISQYSILVRGLNIENSNLKNELNKYKNEEVNNQTETKRYLGEFTLSYYCTETYSHICGGGGSTASGTQVTANRTVAVDPSVIPLGTKLYIEGIGYRIAEDTGGSINGNKIDVAVETHNEAIINGIDRNVKVWIVE